MFHVLPIIAVLSSTIYMIVQLTAGEPWLYSCTGEPWLILHQFLYADQYQSWSPSTFALHKKHMKQHPNKMLKWKHVELTPLLCINQIQPTVHAAAYSMDILH